MRRLSLTLVFLLLSPFPARADIRAELEKRALQYFLDHSHPFSGLVRDRALNRAPSPTDPVNSMASLAATGFGMAALANGSARGLLPQSVAQDKILRALRFTLRHLDHHRGWLYHFVDWSTGRRYGQSEVSTVDTGWFVAGALYASAIFPGGEIARLTRAVYRRLDFADMMTHGGKAPGKRTLSMGWLPESGYLPPQWDSYSEHLLLVILGLGHPTRPLPVEAWDAWGRMTTAIAPGIDLLGSDQSLFVHQYSHLFIDFRKWQDEGFDYFRNSVLATLRDRSVCAADSRYASYRAGFWGLSASGSTQGYRAFSPTFHNGTVCPACAGASALFLRKSVLSDLETWASGPYRKRLWGRYGFSDSVNLDEDWFDPDVIGITVGALYLALADLDPRFRPWSIFERLPSVRRGLNRALSQVKP